jgi:DNA repair exonuclease SbcCD nuclease subunit
MTTILLISDTHISATSPRWPECQRVLAWFADLAVREADLVIHCGDLYDRASTPVDRAFAASWLTRMASVCPVIVVRGNHDVSRDLEILAALATEHPIHVAEEPCVIVEAGVVVQCLPWPRVAELAARTGATGADLDERARDALRDVLRGLAVEASSLREGALRDCSPDAPVILATHALITGAITSHGQPLVGGELALGLADLALSGADVVIAGHIHAPQEWEYGGKRIAYCGSPFATAFGEHERKTVIMLDVEDDGRVLLARRATPAQRMIDVDTAWTAGGWRADGYLATARLLGGDDAVREVDVRGHQVRLRYTVAAEHREAARAEAAKRRDGWLAAGAERVVVEPEVLVASTARAPEIARATTVREQVEAMWTARSDRPADADGVLSALAEIEEG